MYLTCGLIGLPAAGKTTIYNLLTGSLAQTSAFLSGKADTNVGTAKVPDERVDFLAGLYRPRKTTYAMIQFSDVPGLGYGSSREKKTGNQFLNAVRSADMLIHVVRAFCNPELPHVESSINPFRDIETISTELLFADMEIIERKISRLKGSKRTNKEEAFELLLMEKCLRTLEDELPIGDLDLDDNEKLALKSYGFLTEKPMLIVINTDERQFKTLTFPFKEEVERYAVSRNLPLLEICGQLEMEIGMLPLEERGVFLADLGVNRSGIDRLARLAYDYLGLFSFFTVGEDEVRAWTIPKGTKARQAAGKVHSDMERGFIKAEVVKYRDLVESGSMAGIKERGLYRLEGKEYLVEDGDIINFRFNV
jgi:hypothetical protein